MRLSARKRHQLDSCRWLDFRDDFNSNTGTSSSQVVLIHMVFPRSSA